MVESLVVKFGGSCLSSPSSVAEASMKVAAEVEKGRKIVVVVSAMSGVTESLLKTAYESTGKGISKEDMDEVLSMGERTAERVMTSALKSQGLKATGIDPSSSLWPIHTDSEFGDAEVNLEKTSKSVENNIKPLLEEGYVVVVPGFIGLSPEGKVTTLGRGGSDITAVVLGRCLNADEVVFVKDVKGVLSADPRRVATAEKIDLLDAEEMFNLSSAGAKVLHPKTLKYKTDALTFRVVGFDEEDLSKGTVIKGKLEAELKASLHANPLSMVTLVGQEVSTTDTLATILSEASRLKSKTVGITLAPPSLLLYVEHPSDLIQHLHDLIKNQKVAKAIHSFDPLAMIVVSGYGLEKIPGIVDAVVAPLAGNGINLYGVLTISSSVRLFVPWNDRERALSLVEENLGKLRSMKGV